MDQVINISWRTTSGVIIGGFEYEYDAAGRIVSRRQEIGDPSHPSQMSQKNYAYDDLDRLASDGDVTYTYDAAGNRMTKTEEGETITCTLGVGDRLAAWNGGAYSYDAAGNVTHIERDGRPTLDLIWNSQYQLVSVSTNGVFAEGYAYDALCRRVSTTTQEGTTRHVYDNNWQVIADLDEDGDVVASYTWGEGIDNLLAVNIDGATYCPLTDIQGTVWGYVDSQNNVVARWQYDAWGNVVDEEFAPNAVALAAIRYRFQCREWSAATGLVNFRMRWYDPETGRWLSKDPIGLRGGLNLYAFCDDLPNLKLDSDGQLPLPLIAGLVGGAGGGLIGGISNAFQGKSVVKGVIAGAIGGAVAGATMGLATPLVTGIWSGVGIGAATGGLGGAASGVTEQLLRDSDECFDWSSVGMSTLGGAIGGAVGGGISGAAGDALALPSLKGAETSLNFATSAWSAAGPTMVEE